MSLAIKSIFNWLSPKELLVLAILEVPMPMCAFSSAICEKNVAIDGDTFCDNDRRKEISD